MPGTTDSTDTIDTVDSNDQELRRHLVEILRSGHAHAGNARALRGLRLDLAGSKPSGVEHSLWQLLEHLRIAQHDILDFSTNSHYGPRKWPDDYWPGQSAPASQHELDESVRAFFANLDEMIRLVEDPGSNLYSKIPWGEGQTLLREAMLVADHNSYHLGQIVSLRKLLADW